MKTDNSPKAGIALPMLLLTLFISTLVTTPSVARGIFKCVMPDGNIEYTQSPSEECKSQQIKIKGGNADQSAIDKLNEDKKRARLAADQKKTEQQKQKDKQRTEKEMEEYCQSLRDNLEQITIATRVFETDDQGNRTRLTEEQRQERIKENEEKLADHCR